MAQSLVVDLEIAVKRLVCFCVSIEKCPKQLILLGIFLSFTTLNIHGNSKRTHVVSHWQERAH